MLRRRPFRLCTALLAVMSLLFAQLALASYVCPGQPDVDAMVAMIEAGTPCEGMDTDQAALCHQHAADPGQTFEVVKLPAVGQPTVTLVLEMPLVLQARQARAVPTTASPEAQPPPDPLFLSTLRLRV